jgi:hypothetical protein
MRRVYTWFSMKHTVCVVSTPDSVWNTLHAKCLHLIQYETRCMRSVYAWFSMKHYAKWLYLIQYETRCMRSVYTWFSMKHTVCDVSTPDYEIHSMRSVYTWFSMKHAVCEVSTPDLVWNTLYATCLHLDSRALSSYKATKLTPLPQKADKIHFTNMNTAWQTLS